MTAPDVMQAARTGGKDLTIFERGSEQGAILSNGRYRTRKRHSGYLEAMQRDREGEAEL
jgi:hypothetical protein